MSLAHQEARRFRHHYLRPPHVLLALAKQKTGVASRVLSQLGIDYVAIQGAVRTEFGPISETEPTSSLPFSSGTTMLLWLAKWETQMLRDGEIETEHLLIGLVSLAGFRRVCWKEGEVPPWADDKSPRSILRFIESFESPADRYPEFIRLRPSAYPRLERILESLSITDNKVRALVSEIRRG